MFQLNNSNANKLKKGTNIMTDKKLFNEMFKKIRKEGFIARQNFKCCQSCAMVAIDNIYGNLEDGSNYVFYTNQEAESFEKNGKLFQIIYLAWGGDGDKIKSIIQEHGFEVEWNGSKDECIGVLPKTA